MGESRHSSGASCAICKTGGLEYMSEGHLQLYRSRASVTVMAAQDAHTYCGLKLSSHLLGSLTFIFSPIVLLHRFFSLFKLSARNLPEE